MSTVHEHIVLSLVNACEAAPALLNSYLSLSDISNNNNKHKTKEELESHLLTIENAIRCIRQNISPSPGNDDTAILTSIQNELHQLSGEFRPPTEPNNASWFTSEDPQSWQGIEEINLIDNQITKLNFGADIIKPTISTFPASIGKLTYLLELELTKSYNLQSLPNTVGQLTNLRVLNCT